MASSFLALDAAAELCFQNGDDLRRVHENLEIEVMSFSSRLGRGGLFLGDLAKAICFSIALTGIGSASSGGSCT